jgi:polar amino acid transport system substrate-binding protein
MRYIAFFLAVLCSLPVTARAESITIAADLWCPYNCDPKSDHPGYQVELARKAFAKHGIDVDYIVLPWSRAIDETRKGKYAGVFGTSVSNTPDFVFPQVPQGLAIEVFYVKKGNPWHYSGVASLKDISLGVITEYIYTDELDEYVKVHKDDPQHVQIAAGDDALDTNFKKLLASHLGTLVEDSYVSQYYITQHEIGDKVVKAGRLEPSPAGDNVFIAFSPNDKNAKRYADILSEETKAMRASGELKQILASYGLKDWEAK